MLFRLIYMFFLGNIQIIVEGFFLESFINICKEQNIILWNLERPNSAILKTKISKNDFEKVKKIAEEKSCKIDIERKSGLPFIVNKYKKRKGFVIAGAAIAIFLFIITRFIWNIEIIGLENFSKEELLSCLSKYGIDEGKLKHNLNIEEIKNKILLENDDLSWIGIEIRGTNVIVRVAEKVETPEIFDENVKTNIIANKDGVISKMIVRKGTACVNVGDSVKSGDLLVEGIMEGKYTGAREVNSDAEIYIKNYYEKEKSEPLFQEIWEKTGTKENYVEIYINNFKIIFNKILPNFEKCDTIKTYKKIKVFSNYYFPIEFAKITYFELKKVQKEFTESELTDKIINELQNELDTELSINDEKTIEKQYEKTFNDGIVNVKVIYLIEENIGTKELIRKD